MNVFRFALISCTVFLTAWSAGAAEQATYTVRTQALPEATAAGVSMDYIGFDPNTRSVWVPAGNTGLVVVIDAETGALRTISGFPTAEMGTGDRKRVVGPSSVTVGDGVVYVGNRADTSVCAFDAKSLHKGACHKLDSMPDGLAYVAVRREVWVTTPRDKSIRILDAKSLDQTARLIFDGNPEGFAVDGKRGRFYTNLEDKDLTLAIDLASRKTVATWKPGCGEDGPHGLRVDSERGHLFVACSTRVEVLDAGHGGEVLSSIDTGDGVDDIDYAPATHRVYVGAARAGQLTIANVDAHGKLDAEAKVTTPKGTRNPVVTDKGAVYLTHSSAGELVIATPSK
ncbi:MAG TPA: PQQ-binding-like beta-propeller repeat protein [Thermoanaerobaculia bacterium]|nr:PQQ-binding-like beta-propeller repeat protein [Thermoanaerobaculia bacterium]